MSFTVFRYTNYEESAWVFLCTEKCGTMIEMLRKGIPGSKNTFRELADEVGLAELKQFTEVSTRLGSNTWQVILQHQLGTIEEQKKMMTFLAEVSPEEFINLTLRLRAQRRRQ